MKVNAADVPATEQQHGAFHVVRKRLGAAAGGKQLGTSLVEVPPGKKSWPLHFHTANEEAVFVLEGEGTLRLGDERTPLRAGDYVALPAGPPGHLIENTSAAPLRYLAISTMIEPEVSVYPDSGKVGVRAGEALKDGRAPLSVYKLGSKVDYWEGE